MNLDPKPSPLKLASGPTAPLYARGTLRHPVLACAPANAPAKAGQSRRACLVRSRRLQVYVGFGIPGVAFRV